MTATTHADRLLAAQETFQRLRDEVEALRSRPDATPHQVADTQSRCEIARLRLRVASLENVAHEDRLARDNPVILALRGLNGPTRLVVTVQPSEHDPEIECIEAQIQREHPLTGEGWTTWGTVTTSAPGQALEIR